jgi:hypothetical protein
MVKVAGYVPGEMRLLAEKDFYVAAAINLASESWSELPANRILFPTVIHVGCCGTFMLGDQKRTPLVCLPRQRRPTEVDCPGSGISPSGYHRQRPSTFLGRIHHKSMVWLTAYSRTLVGRTRRLRRRR